MSEDERNIEIGQLMRDIKATRELVGCLECKLARWQKDLDTVCGIIDGSCPARTVNTALGRGFMLDSDDTVLKILPSLDEVVKAWDELQQAKGTLDQMTDRRDAMGF
jgi:hypothetical protein